MGQPGPGVDTRRGDSDANVSSTLGLSTVAVIDGQEQVRDEELCAEIIRTARLSSPRRACRAS